jgi:predicted DNA-binding transcriptional regulator AlpA
MKAKTLNLKQAALLVGVSRRSVYNMMADGRFPRPIKGTKPPRWDIDTIDAWRGKQ